MKFHAVLHSWRPWPILLLFLVLAVLWGRWPVVALDFDLWYHLAGGAWIVEHLRLPDGPFFSFLSSDAWVDYYWLYQVLVHGLHQAGGYAALSVLRALVYLATVWMVYCYLRASEQTEGNGAALLAILVTCAYALALQPRDLLLRPHGFTYLYIVFLHYVLNHRQQWAWWLPPLTVVWANLHGVEYPVVLLLLGAYLGEYFLARLLRRPGAGRLAAVRWPAILSLYAVLATPAGLSLLAKAFEGPPFHELTVIELAAQPLQKFLGFFLYPDGRLVESATNILVLAAAVGAVWLAVARRLRPSRVVLLAGALVLLPMMRRFTFEFMLLTLPVLGDAAALAVEKLRRPVSSRVAAVAAFAAVAVTLWTTQAYFGNRPAYPVDWSRLPVGVCDFLLREGPGGRILNVPNTGGYLQWRLYPRYRIGMDMETMLFSTADLYASTAGFADANVLGKMLARYEPGFLLVGADDQNFKKVVESFPRFAPVFFDDALVLYADADKHPDLVRRFKLEVLDPTGWQAEDFETMDPQRRNTIEAECRRLLDVYPEGLTANTVLAKVLLATDRPQQASVLADLLMGRYPDRYLGFAVKGLAAFKQGRYEEALSLYRQALTRAMPGETTVVLRNIYAAQVRLKDFAKAYETLLAVCNPMRPATSANDLYDLALAAVASGRKREGGALLELARLKTPDADEKRQREIAEMQALVAGDAP